MHEVDMTKCLVLSMQEWRQQHHPVTPQVQTVHLQVGTFTCVEPDQLVTTWRAAVRGSWLDGAELAIETVPLVGRCVLCNGTYSPDPEQAYRSPCCNHPMEEIVSGRELRIRSVEYTQPEVSSTPTESAIPGPAARSGVSHSHLATAPAL
jgi:hydrogenase nickel incorporation protein HypA/HybF